MEKKLVFISWSGPRSKAVAEALYDWLPKVIQAVDPWLSQHDIAKGTRWPLELARGLEQAHFGLSCLTPENLYAPWILFEAGAISKAVEETYIWTYLFDVEYTDIEGPLAQFNHTKAEEEDTKKLVSTINWAVGGAIRESDFDEIFAKWWPELEPRLRDIAPIAEEPKPERQQKDILEEILALVRALARTPPTVSVLRGVTSESLLPRGLPAGTRVIPRGVRVQELPLDNERDLMDIFGQERDTSA